MTDATLAFSQKGQRAYSSSAVSVPTNGVIFAIHVETETVVASATFATGYDCSDDWTGRTLQAGQIYYGRWTAFTATSGTGICHLA